MSLGAMRGGAPTCRGLSLAVLLALLCATETIGGFKLGPKPTKRLGLIVRYRSGGGGSVGIAAASAVEGTSDPLSIAPSLNMFTVGIEDGTSPEVKAAQMNKLGSVLYAVPDAYVYLAAGTQQRMPGEQPAMRVRRQLAASRPPPPRRPRPAPPSRRRRVAPPSPPPPVIRKRPSPPPPRPLPRPLSIRPNDPLYINQWGLPRIKAPQAWTQLTNTAAVLQCVVDTGVMWDHPDLRANLMVMPAAFQQDNYDDNGHGTHVAGIMGAVGNNLRGIAGTSWRAKLLACKALDSTGWGLISKVVECIEFCQSKGARVINTSFVLEELNVALRDAIGNGTAAGVFFSGAAGNAKNNNDLANFYPGGFKFPGNVAVANMDAEGQLHSSSNFGATSVQLAAPGTSILSTWIWPDETSQYYTYNTGTSMSAPFVSAAAAMALAASQGRLSNAEIAQGLIQTSAPVAGLKGKVVSNGVIDLQRLVAWATLQGQRLSAVRKATLPFSGTAAATVAEKPPPPAAAAAAAKEAATAATSLGQGPDLTGRPVGR